MLARPSWQTAWCAMLNHCLWGATVQFVKRILGWTRVGRGSAPVLPEVRGYQIVYNEVTRSQVDPEFEPLANDNAVRADWFEYWPIRQFFAKEQIDESAMYGFFSPKFRLKTGLSGAEMVAFVESAPDADVVLFSPFPEHGACFLNVFEQQQVFESGFLDVCQRFFRSLGDETEVTQMVHHAQSVVFSNFFFAKPHFWRMWLEVCERLFQASEAGYLREGLCEGFLYEAADGVIKPAQRKVFLMERIASYLLGRPNKLRVVSYPIRRMPLFPHSRHLADVFYEMDLLKCVFAQTGDAALLSRFRALQREVLPVVIPGVSMSALPVDGMSGVQGP